MGWKSKKDGTHFNTDKVVRSSEPGTKVNIEIDNNSDDFAEGVKEDFEKKGRHDIMYGEPFDFSKEKYPILMSMGQFDHHPQFMKSKQFGLDDDKSLSEIERDVIDYAEKTKGVIYTQMDGGDGKRYYHRGLKKVNNTGLFEVIPNAYDDNGYLMS